MGLPFSLNVSCIFVLVELPGSNSVYRSKYADESIK